MSRFRPCLYLTMPIVDKWIEQVVSKKKAVRCPIHKQLYQLRIVRLFYHSRLLKNLMVFQLWARMAVEVYVE